jgi:amidase
MVVNDEWILHASISEMQQAMEHGRLTAQGLTAFYLRRIAAYNNQGQAINAVLEVNPDALHIAAALDVERRVSGRRGPLHGIPVLLKDNVDTGDKMHTSAGSLALANNIARKDSFVAMRLRQAGAVILGKANMTEWANFMADNMPNGFSSRGGQVKNPYGDFNVGGSSSGSAAAVAAGFAPLAVGTETSGSILSPASSCSIVGIKPTVGLVSRRGIIPIAHSQDTAGPMARTVADAAVLLGAMAAVDEDDPVTLTSCGHEEYDYTDHLNACGLRGARLGVVREYFNKLNAEVLAVFDQAFASLKGLGAELVEVGEYAPHCERGDYTVLTYEFKPNLNAYLGRLGTEALVHSLTEVIQFNARDPENRLKYGQAVLLAAEEKSGTLTEAEYIKTRLNDLRRCRDEGIDLALKQNNLDALLFPGAAGCFVAAKAGYPSVTVPAGYSAEGRPQGLTFTGGAFTEPLLIKLAYAFEQGTLVRVAPKLNLR